MENRDHGGRDRETGRDERHGRQRDRGGKMRKARKRHKQGQGQGKTDRDTHKKETERLEDRKT